MAKPTRRIRDAADLREHRRDVKAGVTPTGAAGVAVTVGDTLGRAAAAPVNAVTGGAGGTVLLIMGVLVLAYLYVSRRLPNVLKAISLPPDQLGQVTGTKITGPDPSQPPLEGVRPSSNPRYRPRGEPRADTGGSLGDFIRRAEEKRDPNPSKKYWDPRTWKWENPDGTPTGPPRKGGFYVR